MMKKTISTLIIIFIIFQSILPISTSDEVLNLDDSLKIINNINNYINENQTLKEYAFVTVGSILKLYTDVKILNGPAIKVRLIKRNLNRRLIRSSTVLPVMLINIEKLDFTLYYKKDVNNNSRVSYSTLFGEAIYDDEGNYLDMINETLYNNKINKISVKNFTGIFIFFRTRLLRFIPFLHTHRFLTTAQFCFSGFCDNVTKLPT